MSDKPKRLLFSVTRHDCDWQTFCTGGNGGQHRNAKQNGVRCIHRASGAVAEHRDGRDQAKNRREAFVKMANTPRFKAWHRMEVARRLGQAKSIEQRVDEMMEPQNLRVEYL